VPPVQVTLNETAARLLVKLAQENGDADPSSLVMRALGLLDMAQRTRRQGGKLLFENEKGDQSEVAF
jgi:hypothetical protein